MFVDGRATVPVCNCRTHDANRHYPCRLPSATPPCSVSGVPFPDVGVSCLLLVVRIVFLFLGFSRSSVSTLHRVTTHTVHALETTNRRRGYGLLTESDQGLRYSPLRRNRRGDAQMDPIAERRPCSRFYRVLQSLDGYVESPRTSRRGSSPRIVESILAVSLRPHAQLPQRGRVSCKV